MSQSEQEEQKSESINIPEVKPLAMVPPELQTNFSDPADQVAWEAFMRIEPRYRDANRKLAE